MAKEPVTKDYLKQLSDAYYNREALVSDDEYDQLKKVYKEKYPSDPFLKEVGATPALGYEKAKHEIPMGSLIEFEAEEDIYKWADKYSKENEVCASEKLDGLSISITFHQGQLIKAITRGDGDTGEDVTRNVLKMQGMAQKLPVPFTGHLRGEIVLLCSTWNTHFPQYKNPRNGAVGLMRRLDGQGAEHLSIFFYKLYGVSFNTEYDMLGYIKDTLKLKTPRFYKINIQTLIALHKKYEEEVRDKLDYELDGLVVNINDKKRQDEITSDIYYPEYARKYKFESKVAESTLLDVKYQCGRTGAITPVAFILPVECAGVTISRITLHNFDEIERLGIHINDDIKIVRSKDVIPKIVEVIRHNDCKKIEIPKSCPDCGGILEKTESILYCKNENCEAKLLKSLEHWLDVLNIKDFGTKLIEQLNSAGKLNKITDFYKLTAEDISILDRQGERSAVRALKQLHEKKEITIAELLAGLNIRNLSTKRAEILGDTYDLDALLLIKKEDILKLDGFEDTLATYIYEGIQSNKDLIKEILEYTSLKKYSGEFSGQSFCFTGFRNNQLEDKIKEKGGRISNGVTKTLTYLVMKNANSSSSKAQKATAYGTKVITEEDLQKMLFKGLF